MKHRSGQARARDAVQRCTQARHEVPSLIAQQAHPKLHTMDQDLPCRYQYDGSHKAYRAMHCVYLQMPTTCCM
jgi:hypothetical protein